MRPTPGEVSSIRAGAAAAAFGAACPARLFGSRAADTRRGGDIDLHVAAEAADPATVADETACAGAVPT